MDSNCVLVCAEMKEGALDERTFELLGAGKRLAGELGGELSAVILSDETDEAADEISYYGVDTVYKLTGPLLATFSPDVWASAVGTLCKQITPNVLLMLHSYPWMDVGPRLAFRFDSVLTTDCIHLEIDQADGLLLRTKPVYGGSALAVFKYQGSPQLVTVRRNVMKPAQRGTSEGRIVAVAVDIEPSVLKVESIKTVKEEAVTLDKANVIIAGGRGIGGAEGFNQLEDLADSFRHSFDEVMIGCSRPVVDSGWMPPSRQIGLSAAIVQPDLYVAVGISGAIQHLAGMARSRKIVAVNTDANCNMFQVADYGVVDDYRRVIPAIKTKWEELARERH